MLGRLIRRDVRIDEEDADVLFLEGLDGLAAGIVDLAGLADLERRAAENHNFLDLVLHDVTLQGFARVRPRRGRTTCCAARFPRASVRSAPAGATHRTGRAPI